MSAPVVLVTGGTGFLGRHVVRRLQAEGTRVRVLARDARSAADLAAQGVELAPGDLRDANAVDAACRGVDAVVHAGGLSAPWGRWADFHAANVVGTRNVLRACASHGVRRLVHISSPSVAFAGEEQRDVSESAPHAARFLSAYSESKMRAEEAVRASGVQAVILRPKAIFGPGDRSLLPRLIALARAGRLVQIGDGRNLVDLTYVENVADAIALALRSARAAGRTYYVTNGEHARVWEVIAEVIRATGLDPELRRVPLRTAWLFGHLSELRARLFGGEPRLTRYTAAILARTQTYDIRAAREDLGYEPRVSLAEGLRRTLEALRAEA